MSSELEKALERAKYAALPLPRAKSGPTTVFAFHEGHLYIVRNPHTALPNPPISVTVDPAVETIEFTRQFAFELSGVAGFLVKVFGIGNAKAELEAKNIRSATIQMGGLEHHTIETGALIDYLLGAVAPSPARRDVLDPDHFTIVAALHAATFTYTFKSTKGTTVKLTLPEAHGLFQAEAESKVQVTADGRIVVNAPRFIGVVSWDGHKIQKELEKAKRAAGRFGLSPQRVADPLANAVEPKVIRARQTASFPGGRRRMSAR